MSDENVERAAAAIGSVCGMDLTWNQRHEAARAVIAALDASRPREAGSGAERWAAGCAECDAGNFGFLKDGVRKHYRFDGGTYECPRVPATPASAAGREGAVEKARQAFYEAARAVMKDRCDCNERCVNDGLLEAQDAAYDALLAAEAEGGGAS